MEWSVEDRAFGPQKKTPILVLEENNCHAQKRKSSGVSQNYSSKTEISK
jgi:hypothetical protein